MAAVKNFSKPAFEFAGNNKIPLISLRWFLSPRVCDLFHEINRDYLNSIDEALRTSIYTFFKDKGSNTWHDGRYSDVIEFIERDEIVGDIIRHFNIVIRRSFVGLIETGDIIFLFANDNNSFEVLDEIAEFNNLRGRLHFYQDQEDVWYLELLQPGINQGPEFKFFVPDRIMRQWSEFSLNRGVAVNLKQQYFSRIFIFRGQQNNSLPFMVVNPDQEWLQTVRDRIENDDL